MLNRGASAQKRISIHALRVEGDARPLRQLRKSSRFLSTPSGWRATKEAIKWSFSERISIHALRVEGDVLRLGGCCPHPRISIHALRVEGDMDKYADNMRRAAISIHALRVEGDPTACCVAYFSRNFYPRPPGGGRQQKRTKFSSVFAQKGEEFASLRRGKRKICRWRFKKDKFWVLIWCEGSGKSVCALASHCG